MGRPTPRDNNRGQQLYISEFHSGDIRSHLGYPEDRMSELFQDQYFERDSLHAIHTLDSGYVNAHFNGYILLLMILRLFKGAVSNKEVIYQR
jgi:hypothetical protein